MSDFIGKTTNTNLIIRQSGNLTMNTTYK